MSKDYRNGLCIYIKIAEIDHLNQDYWIGYCL